MDVLNAHSRMDNSPPKPSPAQYQRKPTPTFENFGAFHFTGVKNALSPAQTKTWASTLSKTFSRSWANWPETSNETDPKLTMRMNDRVLTYSTEATPAAHFSQAIHYVSEIQGLRTKEPETAADLIAEAVQDDMILVIYGSNAIENAGLGLDETTKICEAIFRGEMIDIEPRGRAYEEKTNAVIQTAQDADQHIIRTRNEVIQHAKALQYITNAVMTEQKEITEKLIQATHAILIKGVDHPKYGTPFREYAGVYRNRVKQPGTEIMGAEVNAGGHHFTASKAVPTAMANLVASLKSDIAEAERTKSLDPFTLAAKYCGKFVCVHPFLDGNGRMCRLLLNVILLKYAGIVVPIGECEGGRKEYLDIKRRYSADGEDEGEFAAMVLKRATLSLKTVRDKLVGACHGKGNA